VLDVYGDRLYSTNKFYVEDLFMCLLIELYPLTYNLNSLKLIKEPEVVPVKMSTEIFTSLHCVILVRHFYEEHNVN
jgi:hypothetical protein